MILESGQKHTKKTPLLKVPQKQLFKLIPAAVCSLPPPCPGSEQPGLQARRGDPQRRCRCYSIWALPGWCPKLAPQNARAPDFDQLDRLRSIYLKLFEWCCIKMTFLSFPICLLSNVTIQNIEAISWVEAATTRKKHPTLLTSRSHRSTFRVSLTPKLHPGTPAQGAWRPKNDGLYPGKNDWYIVLALSWAWFGVWFGQLEHTSSPKMCTP